MPKELEKVKAVAQTYLNALRERLGLESVDVLVRFLNTEKGTDKSFALVENWLQVIALYLRRPLPLYASREEVTTITHGKTRRAWSYGLSLSERESELADRLGAMAGLLGDARMLMRFTGLPAMYKWMLSILRQNPRPLIPTLQALSMLLYYPLEHAYYLAAHNILRVSASTKKQLGLWSGRAFAAYVVLQLLNIRKDWRVLDKEEAALAGQEGEKTEAGLEIRAKRSALSKDLWLNVFYVPMIVHWSLENGLFVGKLWPTVLNTIIATTEFRRDWQALAILAPIRT